MCTVFSRGIAPFLLLFLAQGPVAAQDIRTLNLPPPDRVARAEDLGPLARFNAVVAIREFPDGSLLIADRDAWRLIWLAADFGEVREIPSPTLIDPGGAQTDRLFPWAADSTFWASGSTREWAVLTIVDDTLVVRPFEQDAPVVATLGPIIEGLDRAGRVLGSRPHPYLETEPSDTLLLLLADATGEAIDTIARLKGRARFPLGIPRDVPITEAFRHLGFFQTEEMARLFPDGWVAVARLDPYRVDWRAPDGLWQHGAPLPFEAKALNRQEQCFALEALLQPCESMEERDWPDVVPAFVVRDDVDGKRLRLPTLFATPEGPLLVRRTHLSSRAERWYDVVDRRGALIGRLTMPRNEAIVGFGASSVYTVEVSAGTETLRRHPWPGMGPESGG